jgi:membrane protease YdiL (CAAX protease family)
MNLSRNSILKLGFITLVGMGMAAVVIDRFSETVNLREMIIGQVAWYYQIPIGLVVGIISGIIADFITTRKFMESVRNKYTSMMSDLILDKSDTYFISFCAGVGEEMLFRGAIQPFAGIAFTAVFFVAIHGYLNLKNWRLMVYGVTMTIIIGFIGLMAVKVGLVAAMVAHMFIDVVLLRNMNKEKSPNLES